MTEAKNAADQPVRVEIIRPNKIKHMVETMVNAFNDYCNNL